MQIIPDCRELTRRLCGLAAAKCEQQEEESGSVFSLQPTLRERNFPEMRIILPWLLSFYSIHYCLVNTSGIFPQLESPIPIKNTRKAISEQRNAVFPCERFRMAPARRAASVKWKCRCCREIDRYRFRHRRSPNHEWQRNRETIVKGSKDRPICNPRRSVNIFFFSARYLSLCSRRTRHWTNIKKKWGGRWNHHSRTDLAEFSANKRVYIPLPYSIFYIYIYTYICVIITGKITKRARLDFRQSLSAESTCSPVCNKGSICIWHGITKVGQSRLVDSTPRPVSHLMPLVQ